MPNLKRYRFNLTNATDEEREHTRELIDRYAFTGEMIVSKVVFEGFFNMDEDVEKLIPLPKGCAMQRVE